MSNKTLEISRRIKTLRKWRNFEQAEMALRLQCEQSKISDLESGRVPIPFETLLDIAEILKVDLDFFDLRKELVLPQASLHLMVCVICRKIYRWKLISGTNETPISKQKACEWAKEKNIPTGYITSEMLATSGKYEMVKVSHGYCITCHKEAMHFLSQLLSEHK